MLELLNAWAVGQASLFVFRPIMDELAKDVAKDAAKSYVKKCFESVFSIIYRDPLTKCTGRALNKLLELIQDELLDCDLSREALLDWVDDVRKFTRHEGIPSLIGSLFLEPNYQLDVGAFTKAWEQSATRKIPTDFCWPRIAKRFSREIATIRDSSPDLRDTFQRLTIAQMADDMHQLTGLPPEFNLDTYRDALVERHQNLDFASLDTTGSFYNEVPLWSVFVPQSVRECHEYDPQLLEIPKELQSKLLRECELDESEIDVADELRDEIRRAYFNQPLRAVLEVTDDEILNRLVILGDPGSGKSSLLRYLALRWARIADPAERYMEPLPLLIELREYNRWYCSSGKGFVRYLHEASTWHRLNQQTLNHLLKEQNRVLLLLDGLDEVFDPAQRESVINDIHRFSNNYPNAKIVLTSRVVGYQAQRLRSAEFYHFMLQDLDERQIGSFLDNWHDVMFERMDDGDLKRERLGNAIRDSKAISMLAGNPLLLTLVAILNRHQDLPRDRSELYRLATRVLLQQWDTERALEEYPELRGEVDLRAKMDILRLIAYSMQKHPYGLAGNIIEGDKLSSLIEEFLHVELHFEQSRAAAAALVKQLRERNFILCYLGGDSYAFVHRTFLEYFCASSFVKRFNVEKSMRIKDLIALFTKHYHQDEWREVLRLICGQIDEKFVACIVDRLAKVTNLQAWNGCAPLHELPLAILCLAELRPKNRELEAGKVLLEQVYGFMRKAKYAHTDEFETNLVRFMRDELLGASQELSGRWPCASHARSLALDDLDSIAGDGLFVWSEFSGAVLPDRDFVCELTSSTRGLIRAGAIQCLAGRWPDKITYDLLMQLAVRDPSPIARRAAIVMLANAWTNKDTREFLLQRAVDDASVAPRTAALHELGDKWRDANTRAFIVRRATDDPNSRPRRKAFTVLCKYWNDSETRNLLEQASVKDRKPFPRITALRLMVRSWPDELTREFLTKQAASDKHWAVRNAALHALAEKWNDERTRSFLADRAAKDRIAKTRGVAAHLLALQHSVFGGQVFCLSSGKDGRYLDPLKPISNWQILSSAKRAKVPRDKIQEAVSSLSSFLGWDITSKSGSREQ